MTETTDFYAAAKEGAARRAAERAALAGKFVTVRFTDFSLGLRNAKKAGGKFNAAAKTWDIPAAYFLTNSFAANGWSEVKTAVFAGKRPGIEIPCEDCGSYCNGSC